MFKTIQTQYFKDIATKVLDILPKETFIAGGFVRNMCFDSDFPKDIDVFCSEDSLTLVDKAMTSLISNGFKVVKNNSIVVTLFPSEQSTIRLPMIQIIKPRILRSGKTYGEMSDVINSFDFTVCRGAIVNPDTALVDEDFEKDNTDKKLVIKNIVCPVGNAMRVIRYRAKGYDIAAKEMFKLFLDWELLSDTNKAILAHVFDMENADTADFDLSEEEIDAFYKAFLLD